MDAQLKVVEELLENRKSFVGGVKAGMDVSWQDNAENIATAFRRFFGTDEADIAAWEKNRKGQGFLMPAGDVLGENVDILAPGVVTFKQVAEIGKLVGDLSPGDVATARQFMTDFVQILVAQGSLGPGIGRADVYKIVNALTAPGESSERPGAVSGVMGIGRRYPTEPGTPDEQAEMLRMDFISRNRSRVEKEILISRFLT